MTEFLLHNPQSLSKLLISCEHASKRLPFRRGVGGIQRRILDSHWGWDVGAWELSLDLARRLDVSLFPGERAEEFLARILPHDSLVFWPADRF